MSTFFEDNVLYGKILVTQTNLMTAIQTLEIEKLKFQNCLRWANFLQMEEAKFFSQI